MSFFSALFGGQNKTLSDNINKTGQISDFSSGQGQKNTSAGSSFFNSILSGDTGKIAQALAPAISAGQQGVQQQKNQIAQFGNRSGGSTAKANALESENRGNITNLVGGLQSGSASALLNSGSSLLGTALGGLSEQTDMSQQRIKNWQDSIFGGSLTSGAAIGMKALGDWAG